MNIGRKGIRTTEENEPVSRLPVINQTVKTQQSNIGNQIVKFVFLTFQNLGTIKTKGSIVFSLKKQKNIEYIPNFCVFVALNQHESWAFIQKTCG